MLRFWRDSATKTRQHSKFVLVDLNMILLSTIKPDVTGHFSLENNEDPVVRQRDCKKAHGNNQRNVLTWRFVSSMVR